jgi:hypothetical protein
LEALSSQGFDILLLKGVPLVLDYYRNHALRPMEDVDLVVPFQQAPAAVECMAGLGWNFLRPVDDDMLRYHHAVQCFGPDGEELDLHWRVTYEACTDDADRMFWERSEALDFLGLQLRQLDPTALLLQTILHGVRWNREPPIRWIPDSLTILRTRGEEVDWEEAIHLAVAIQAPVRFRLGLDYLRDVHAAPIPLWVTDSLPQKAISLREHLDNAALMKGAPAYEGSVLSWHWALFSEYCRRYWARGPVDFVLGYSHFLRFRWGLDGRREILPIILKGLGRRLVGQESPLPELDAELGGP